MDTQADKRAWGNLRRGLAWLAFGALAVIVVEYAWDCFFGNRPGGESNGSDIGEVEPSGAADSLDAMLAFALGDEDEPAAGAVVVPPVFVKECFDPYAMGEVSVSDDGGVVGIVSDKGADDLFGDCAHWLEDKGWIQVESGHAHRCTFLKDTGEVHWLFLDVTQVSDSGVAVVVMQGGA